MLLNIYQASMIFQRVIRMRKIYNSNIIFLSLCIICSFIALYHLAERENRLELSKLTSPPEDETEHVKPFVNLENESNHKEGPLSQTKTSKTSTNSKNLVAGESFLDIILTLSLCQAAIRAMPARRTWGGCRVSAASCATSPNLSVLGLSWGQSQQRWSPKKSENYLIYWFSLPLK